MDKENFIIDNTEEKIETSDFAVTGDTHGEEDFYRFIYAKGKGIKTLIICGDFGYIWGGINENIRNLRMIDNFEFDEVLFIDGNHENFDELNKFPIKEWNGGLVHELPHNVRHLIRGEIYNIKGKSIAVMGGAASTDKHRRTEGLTWWKEEMPSLEERQNLINNLEKCNWKVDIFLSHTAPSKVLKEMNAKYRIDEFTDFLDEIECKLEYKKWYFGHMHRSFSSKLTKCECIYDYVEYI